MITIDRISYDLDTDHMSEAEFTEHCFRSWLNIIDARIGYGQRKANASVDDWRLLFEDGYSEYEAIFKMTGLRRPEIID